MLPVSLRYRPFRSCLTDALLFDASTHPRECASILLNDTEFKRKRPSHQRPHVLSEYLPLRRESYDMSTIHVSTTLSPPQNTFRRLSMPMRPALDWWSAENEVAGRGRRRQLRNGWYPVRAEIIS
ncbi:hypothetical protein B0H11DRAFT_1934835 [Mycena galericulata]|nr:hypothetical protein B0H11DRAFT_1934835 [Mycena galericulata]